MAGLPLELRPSTPAVHSPLTCVLVVAHDVFQVLQEEVPPGLLKFTQFLPVLHSFHLFPWAQGFSFFSFTIVVEEGLVVEVASCLKPGEALLGLGYPIGVVGQRISPCKRGEKSELWESRRGVPMWAAEGQEGRPDHRASSPPGSLHLLPPVH